MYLAVLKEVTLDFYVLKAIISASWSSSELSFKQQRFLGIANLPPPALGTSMQDLELFFLSGLFCVVSQKERLSLMYTFYFSICVKSSFS